MEKLGKKITDLQLAIKQYKEYVLSEDPISDIVEKYENYVLESAIEQELGQEWWVKYNKIFD